MSTISNQQIQPAHPSVAPKMVLVNADFLTLVAKHFENIRNSADFYGKGIDDDVTAQIKQTAERGLSRINEALSPQQVVEGGDDAYDYTRKL